MPILCYEITGISGANALSTTDAQEGHLGAIVKGDHDAAQGQIYSELVANRLAMFLGIPVAVGVPARSQDAPLSLRFACLRAAEHGLDMYDFTENDLGDAYPDDDESVVPNGMYRTAGHVHAMTLLSQKYPLEIASVAVFDLWIGNEDRPLNFKAELNNSGRGVMFALDQGSSVLACQPTIDSSLEYLAKPDFPSFHPFQNLVNAKYCNDMVEKIISMPDWAILAATSFDDTIGNVTIAEQVAAYEALIQRKLFLSELVSRVLFGFESARTGLRGTGTTYHTTDRS